jgi:hypothetical protein
VTAAKRECLALDLGCLGPTDSLLDASDEAICLSVFMVDTHGTQRNRPRSHALGAQALLPAFKWALLRQSTERVSCVCSRASWNGY